MAVGSRVNAADSEVRGPTTGVQRRSLSGTTGRHTQSEQAWGSAATGAACQRQHSWLGGASERGDTGVLRQAQRGSAFRAQPAEGQAQEAWGWQPEAQALEVVVIDWQRGWLHLDRPLPSQLIADTVSDATEPSAPNKEEAAEMSSSYCKRRARTRPPPPTAATVTMRARRMIDVMTAQFLYRPGAAPPYFVTAVLRSGGKLCPARECHRGTSYMKLFSNAKQTLSRMDIKSADEGRTERTEGWSFGIKLLFANALAWSRVVKNL